MKRLLTSLVLILLVSCFPQLTGRTFEVLTPTRYNFYSSAPFTWQPESACEKVDIPFGYGLTCNVVKVPTVFTIATEGEVCKGEGDNFLPDNMQCE